MTDHNGQYSDKIIAYMGDTRLLQKLCVAMCDKGFKSEYIPTPSDYTASVVLYPYHQPRFDAYRRKTVIAEEYISVTPENIDTFINNLQP